MGLEGKEVLGLEDTGNGIQISENRVLFGPEGAQVVIGEMQEADSHRMVISMTEDANSLALEAFIRSCVYHADGELPGGASREVEFQFNFGENAIGHQSTTKTIRFGTSP